MFREGRQHHHRRGPGERDRHTWSRVRSPGQSPHQHRDIHGGSGGEWKAPHRLGDIHRHRGRDGRHHPLARPRKLQEDLPSGPSEEPLRGLCGSLRRALPRAHRYPEISLPRGQRQLCRGPCRDQGEQPLSLGMRQGLPAPLRGRVPQERRGFACQYQRGEAFRWRLRQLPDRGVRSLCGTGHGAQRSRHRRGPGWAHLRLLSALPRTQSHRLREAGGCRRHAPLGHTLLSPPGEHPRPGDTDGPQPRHRHTIRQGTGKGFHPPVPETGRVRGDVPRDRRAEDLPHGDPRRGPSRRHDGPRSPRPPCKVRNA